MDMYCVKCKNKTSTSGVQHVTSKNGKSMRCLQNYKNSIC